ncbi:MAG: twin-arginine translocase subunit TatC [Candidatus Omnitrophica bacterium]|nr:twin-arginine translocase subunit TatC [Candidatus Omnitrophota bacterium]
MADLKMTVVEHLDELRSRLIVSLAAVVVSSCLAFWKVKVIVQWMIIPPVDRLVFFSPAEAFTAYCKVAVFAGIILASPVILFQIWSFVSSGLESGERRTALLYIPFAVALFLCGAAFAFFIVIPWALDFLINFAGPEMVPMISISKYLSFIIMLVLIFGVVFEFPVAVILLTKLGLVNAGLLSRNRKYAIVIIFIAAAVLTPTPDAFTMILMAVPMVVLYEMSIWLSKLVKRRV